MMGKNKSETETAIVPIPFPEVVGVNQPFENDERTPQTVPPCVISVKDRNTKNGDKPFADALIICYSIFLASSIWIFANAHPKYKISEGGEKTISDYYYSEAEKCCVGLSDINDDERLKENGLCSMVQLNMNQDERNLNSIDSPVPKLLGDEGIFDAFVERPDIILYIAMVIISIAISWVYLLRIYAKPVVVVTEIIKILGIITIGAKMVLFSPGFLTKLVGMSVTIAYLYYVYHSIDNILNASRVITLSVTHISKNADMAYKLIILKIMYCLQVLLGFAAINASFEIVDVKPLFGSCYFVSPGYIGYLNMFQVIVWSWTLCTLDAVRLFIVAYITGSSYFQQTEKDVSITRFSSIFCAAFSKSSLGTLAISGLVTSFFQFIRNRNKRYIFWIGPQITLFMLIECCICFCGSFLVSLANVWTKFSVVIHAFKGESFGKSSDISHKILRRRFIGGYIMETTSSSVLWLAEVIFSVLVTLISWGWFDAAFNHTSYQGNGGVFIVPIAIILFMFSPVIGILIIISINVTIQRYETNNYEMGRPTYQHLWVPPLAALLVGFATKLVFTYMGGIIQDAVDTMLLCFAIDEDNGVENRSQDEFTVIAKDMKEYIKADPVAHYDIEAELVAENRSKNDE